MDKRTTMHAEKKAAFDEQTQAEIEQRKVDYPEEEIDPDEFPAFDDEEFYAKFDEDNPTIQIPDEVVDDVDNDFNLTIPDDPVEE